ncbi:hypothetical protein BZA05DRAFT_227625 [Tricharina praecox]|uniref:uncharacterized protein n=1 Tax=Tricharina praecox TaxID=43433 RepID=UPI0022202428|nr:uncharacterized protein BZA05DRAFT_227625 [Tricharina praecox]KAI5841319.1 hypothetical protein BZA05DRAFT_227625 [Tricharina praecox]
MPSSSPSFTAASLPPLHQHQQRQQLGHLHQQPLLTPQDHQPPHPHRPSVSDATHPRSHSHSHSRSHSHSHSQSPQAPGPRPPPQPAHKRTYQACIPCRQRKVRCDLGSVEAPHDPPCVRCRRESKECFFSATRRKRTPSVDIPPGLGRGRGVRKPEDSLENGEPKRVRTHSHPQPQQHDPVFHSPDYSPSYRTYAAIDPALNRADCPPPPPPPPPASTATTTDTLLQTEVYNSHEALLTLIEAAGKDTPMMKNESRSTSTQPSPAPLPSSSSHSHVHSPVQTSSATAAVPRWNNQSVHFSGVPDESEATTNSHTSSHLHKRSNSGTSPKTGNMRLPVHDDGTEKALKAWNKFRFVKAGWFSAREAIGYVEYFYKHLHPLSPTLTNPTLLHVSHRRHHHLLLRNEPFLATTILTVASRYMTLPGPGGVSRSFAIHDMLWREVRSAFERLMWGGGWGGLGVPRPPAGSTLSPASTARTGRGLRTIGTVEGLLILSEWHVRGLHFPMDVEESDWGISDMSDDEKDEKDPSSPTLSRRVVEGLGDKIENILEPAYRSDRMSWMLLGNALALAYELGVFDNNNHDERAARIQKLLLVYIKQLASRLGWTSMVPPSLSPAAASSSSHLPTAGDWSDPDALQDAVFGAWVDLTNLMAQSSELLFPSRAQTREIMRSGRYVELLTHFQPLLRAWRDRLEALQLPQPIRSILEMEWEHVRFYINSLSLQAVIDRCSLSGGSARPDISTADTGFIREVVAASRSLLATVVESMYEHGYLKHAPVRIYLRILSASMFLLKTFSLGAKEVEVERSLELVESVCTCLRSAAVDDVHLGLRFADLLAGLVGRVRARFVKMPLEEPLPNNNGNNNNTTVGEMAWEPQQQQQQQQEDLQGVYDWGWGSEDWLALPLDPILGFEGVTQGTMGVDVGGMDLLEVLLAPAGG